MRLMTISLGLVALLATCNRANGQFNTKEYLLSITKLATQNGLDIPYTISPMENFQYLSLLLTYDKLKAFAFMIRMKAEAEYNDAWHLSNSIETTAVADMLGPVAKPDKAPVEMFLAIPVPFTKEPTLDPVSESNTPPVVAKAATASKPGATAELIAATHLDNVVGGDHIEFGSIGFYQDAATIRASFKAEMESLASHLKKNPGYTIRIHGHCNGVDTRNVIARGTGASFFEINGNNHIKSATAKELTELRAESAKQYLITQGIAGERIQIIGEGGTRMIYPQTSIHAHYNDRIELEIIQALNN